MPDAKIRRFELHRDSDVTGVSGTGVVAEGVAFSDGTVALRWTSEWPTSVVFHDRGVEAVQKIHGHGGATRIVWLDMLNGPPGPGLTHEDMWMQLSGYVMSAAGSPSPDDAKEIYKFMRELTAQRLAPVKEWMESISASGCSAKDTTEAKGVDHG